MTTVCTICARGGSKGVPGKNIRPFAGRPLIAWTVALAAGSGLFDIIAVSSDSREILEAAKAASPGVLLVDRPPEMATDTAAKLPAIRHAALAGEQALGRKASLVVDLQPTSPLRTAGDIAGAIALQRETGADSVITGQSSRCPPYFSLVERAPDGTVFVAKSLGRPIVRRQDAPACYDMNGSVYVWKRDVLVENPAVFYPSTRLYEMPEERSFDIDTELDFAIAEFVMVKVRHD